MNIVTILLLTAAAFFLGSFLVELTRRFALHRQLLDQPNDRSSHTNPTPRGGGIAVVLVTLGGWVAWHLYLGKSGATVWTFPIAAAMVAGISWMDDLRSLPTSLRFATHLCAAGMVMAVHGRFAFLPTGSEPGQQVFLNSWALPITILWIVGLTNAYNFMDGIDGIAGLQAVLISAFWTALALAPPFWLMPEVRPGDALALERFGLLGALLLGSSLAFLIRNWPPAKIFMGDVGSAFYGFTFAAMPVIGYPVSRGNVFGDVKTPATGLLVPALLCVWPFVFDTIFTIINRLRKGENVLLAHRSHLFQRLVISGYSHAFVTCLYATMSLAGCAFAWAMTHWPHAFRNEFFAALPCLALSLWGFTRWRETCCYARHEKSKLPASSAP